MDENALWAIGTILLFAFGSTWLVLSGRQAIKTRTEKLQKVALQIGLSFDPVGTDALPLGLLQNPLMKFVNPGYMKWGSEKNNGCLLLHR